MKNHFIVISFIALLLFISCSEETTKPKNFVLLGVIQSADIGESIANAQIRVKNLYLNETTYSDKNGEFMFSYDDMEGYGVDLFIEKSGYNPRWFASSTFSTNPTTQYYFLDPSAWIGDITGKVKESAVGIISNAQVKLYRIGFETLIDQTISDIEGNYSFQNIPTGFYRLEAYHQSLGEDACSIVVHNGELVNQDLCLHN